MRVKTDRPKKKWYKNPLCSSPATTRGTKTDNLKLKWILNIYINGVQQDTHLKHHKKVPLGAG